jgi:hypothetical protein
MRLSRIYSLTRVKVLISVTSVFCGIDSKASDNMKWYPDRSDNMMRSLLRFGLAATALAGVAATVDFAKADTISIGWSSTMGGAVTMLATGSGNADFGGGLEIGPTDFFASSIGGTGSPPLTLPSLFDSNNLSLTSTNGGTIFIWITDSNITNPLNGVAPFVSRFTADNVGVVATLQTFYDSGDGVFTHVTSIGGPFTSPSGSLQTDTAQANITLTGSPYSITALYELVAALGANANDTIDVSVPGPVVGAGLPGLLAACGGLIALARRRRRNILSS